VTVTVRTNADDAETLMHKNYATISRILAIKPRRLHTSIVRDHISAWINQYHRVRRERKLLLTPIGAPMSDSVDVSAVRFKR
jgi:hypothetical protein